MKDSTRKEALCIFFDVSEEKITEDISIAGQDVIKSLKNIKTDLEKYYSQDEDKRKPVDIAKHWHDMMLVGCVNADNVNIHEYEAFFCVVYSANDVAQEACHEASESPGQLQELSKQMQEIEKREGLERDEYWPPKKGPIDYVHIEEKWERLYDCIRCAVIACILRKYGFEEYAKLLDENRMEFEVRKEAGRRAMHGAGNDKVLLEAERKLEDSFVNKYGEEAVKLLKTRIEEIKNYRKKVEG